MTQPKESQSVRGDVMDLVIYACGGAGGKIVSSDIINGAIGFHGFANSKIVYFDSSASDLLPGFKGEVEINPVWDGFGKNQTIAFENIKNSISSNLKKHPPGKLNVVVFGLSGATGSVMGTLLVDALLAQGLPTVLIGIAAAECKRTTENTLKTLKGLTSVAKKHNRPVVLSYHDNYGRNNSFLKVNHSVALELRALMVLGSTKNINLDSTDIANVLNYPSVTEHTSGLVDLLISYGPECELGTAIASVSLLQTPDSPSLKIKRFYSATGYMPANTVTSTKDPLPDHHFIVTKELMKSRRLELERQVEEYEIDHQLIIATSDDSDDYEELTF